MELRDLDAVRDRSPRQSPRIALVTGPGGVGKSALAAEWGHRASSQFPEGQLYVDLGGFSGDAPISPADILGRFLRAIGVPPGQVPIEVDELAALFRTATADRRLLVVLDNAVSSAQVTPLLAASPTVMTIVTSRSRLNGLSPSGPIYFQVTPLTRDEGVLLLSNIVGEDRVASEPESARELVGMCDGLPIALVITGARLNTRPHRTIRDTVIELADEQRRLTWLSTTDGLSVHAAFDASVRGLSSLATRLYGALSVHPGVMFGAGVAAAAICTTAQDADRVVDELLHANLLQEVRAQRFQLHDLVRLHARHQITEAEAELALHRMVNWYLHTADAADRLIVPHRDTASRRPVDPPIEPGRFYGRDDALAWLVLERANLLTAARAAVSLCDDTRAWQIADAMWGLWLYHSYHREQIEFDQIGIAAARRCNNRAAEAEAEDRLGLAYNALHESDQALGHMKRALAIWHERDESHRIARSTERLGFVHLNQGRVDRAIDHFRQALDGYQRQGSKRDTALAMISLGQALCRVDRVAEAINYFQDATSLLESLAVVDEYNIARALTALGRAESSRGDYQAASEHIHAALDTMRRLNSSIGQADALEVSAQLAQRLADVTTARGNYESALEIYESLGDSGAVRVRDKLLVLKQPDSLQHWTTAHTLTAHNGPVTCVAFSPNSRLLATSSTDMTIRLWDTNTGRTTRPPLIGHTGPVWATAFSPDGRLLASAGADTTVRLWEPSANHPDPIAVLNHDGFVVGLAFGMDGRYLASGGGDTTIRIWSTTTTGKLIHHLRGHQGAITSMACGPQGLLATSSADATVQIWDLGSGRRVGPPLTNHDTSVDCVAFSTDGTLLATGTASGIARVWSMETRELMHEPLVGHTEAIWGIAFSPLGLLATASRDKSLRLWDEASGLPVTEPITGHTSALNVTAFGSTGRLLATASDDNTARLWRPSLG